MPLSGQPAWHDRLLWPLVLLVVMLAVWGVWQPYSLWLDEIFSVVAASESVADMFMRWILIDVHPPLYQLMLNAWVHALGAGEFAVRSLSTLSALLVVVLAVRLSRQRRDLTGYVLMLLVMPWFFYNAQEARSYILVYLFATLALYGQLVGRHGLFLAGLVLMSWTHYFGLFLAMALLFVHVVMAWRLTAAEVLTAVLMLSWLPVHMSQGTLLDNAGGGFWIQVSGPGETIANLFSAISPGFLQLWRLHGEVSWLYALVLMSWLGYFPWRQWRRGDVDRMDLQLSWSLLLFVSGIVVVDHIVSMSTSRNFLVAMPAMIFLLYRVARQTLGASSWSLVLCGWLLVQVVSGVVLMQHKHSEIENYRKATAAVLSAMDTGARGYYLDTCAAGHLYNSDAMNNYYMARFDVRGRRLEHLCQSALPALAGDVVVMACHQMPMTALAAMLPAGFHAVPMDAKGLCSVILPVRSRKT